MSNTVAADLAERRRVLAAMAALERDQSLLALTLAWTSARLCEALALLPLSFQIERASYRSSRLIGRFGGIFRHLAYGQNPRNDIRRRRCRRSSRFHWHGRSRPRTRHSSDARHPRQRSGLLLAAHPHNGVQNRSLASFHVLNCSSSALDVENVQHRAIGGRSAGTPGHRPLVDPKR
jgi:hypothetical protein